MSNLTMKEKLTIVNSGGSVEETGNSSWVNISVRKGKLLGKVTKDMNGRYRELTVKFRDGSEEIIRMNNIGIDPSYIHQYEWYDRQVKTWYTF